MYLSLIDYLEVQHSNKSACITEMRLSDNNFEISVKLRSNDTENVTRFSRWDP